MPGATFSRVKNWVAELLTYADLNAEIDNILSNLLPAGVDDYSVTTTQMRLQTDPGESGTESQATSLAGELERLRYVIAEMKGETYWYQTADATLAELASALGTSTIANRISSGRMRTSSSQPIFLVPHGAARTVTLDGTPTSFVYYVAGVQYTISSDVTLTSLTAAPSSNNTCTVNMPGVAANTWTRMLGEYGSSIQVDAMGSEISNLTGKICGFKLAGAATEYFIGRVDSTTQISNCQRGFFFDSSDAPINRTTLTDNDTITLMKLTWVYATTSGTLTASYTNPSVQADEPSSPAQGDYWYDTANNIWKVYGVSSWASAAATLVGVCIQDTSNTVAARSFDFFKSHNAANSAIFARKSTTQCHVRNLDAEVAVYGTVLRFPGSRVQWTASTDFDSGVTQTASTNYYCYLTEGGDTIISDKEPRDRTADLKGLYHPHHTWRCLGSVFNTAANDFNIAIDYGDTSHLNIKTLATVASSALTIRVFANPLSKIHVSTYDVTDVADYVQLPCMASLVVPSTATLGHKDATSHKDWIYVARGTGNNPQIAISMTLLDTAGALSATAIDTGADSNRTIYATSAHSSVGMRVIARLVGTQTTAGTWATVPTVANFAVAPTLAEDPIAFKAVASSTSISNALGSIVFSTVSDDTHNAYSTANGLFVAPRAGYYEISAGILAAATTGGDDAVEIALNLGGAAYVQNRQRNATSSNFSTWITARIKAAAGDQINVQFALEGTSPAIAASTTYNYFTGAWVGNS